MTANEALVHVSKVNEIVTEMSKIEAKAHVVFSFWFVLNLF